MIIGKLKAVVFSLAFICVINIFTGTLFFDFDIKSEYEEIFTLQRSGEYSQSVQTFSDEKDGSFSEEVLPTKSKIGNYFGIGFLAFLTCAISIVFIILFLIFIFKWKKVKATSKFLFSGCLLVIFIVLIIALIGTALALYSVFNGGSDKTQKASEPRIESISDEKNVEEYLELKKTMDADSTAEIDDEQICKMAFEKFQSAIKLSEEAEAKGDIALYEMALAEIEAALQLDTSNQAYWMLVGKLYSQMCPDLEIQLYAEHFLRKSLELAPLSADARLLLGNCLFQQKIYSEAIAEFEKALENEPRKLTEPLVPVIAAAYVYDSQYEKGENFLRVFSRGVRALMPSEYLWQL